MVLQSFVLSKLIIKFKTRGEKIDYLNYVQQLLERRGIDYNTSQDDQLTIMDLKKNNPQIYRKIITNINQKGYTYYEHES